MARPTASVIVPVLGTPAEVTAVARRFAGLRLGPGDEVIVVDNGPREAAAGGGDGADTSGVEARVRVVWAGEVASSYHARNAGAARASGEWLVFCDADTEPVEALLDAYFDPSPRERAGILAGGIRDHPEGDGVAPRLQRETGAMDQAATLANPYRPYAVTANCAFRAEAFHAVDGFDGTVRSGGDADLCWRLQTAGWELEERPAALVDHHNRPTLRALWPQRARHGAGAAWLAGRHPGAMPRWGPAALTRDSARQLVQAARALGSGNPGDAAVQAAIPSAWWAFELGRLRSNRARRR